MHVGETRRQYAPRPITLFFGSHIHYFLSKRADLTKTITISPLNLSNTRKENNYIQSRQFKVTASSAKLLLHTSMLFFIHLFLQMLSQRLCDGRSAKAGRVLQKSLCSINGVKPVWIADCLLCRC